MVVSDRQWFQCQLKELQNVGTDSSFPLDALQGEPGEKRGSLDATGCHTTLTRPSSSHTAAGTAAGTCAGRRPPRPILL